MAAIEITCRCGWSNGFDESQSGLTLSCPQCGRSFEVTADRAHFLNSNVGPQDLAFAEDPEAPERPALRVAPKERIAGRPAGSSISYRAAPRKSGARATRHARPPGANPWRIVAVVGVVALVVGGVGYALAGRSRERVHGAGEQFAARTVEQLSGGHFNDALPAFSSLALLKRVEAELARVAEACGHHRFQHERARWMSPTGGGDERLRYRAVAKGQRRGFRLTLIIAPHAGAWRVADATVEEIPPAHL